MASSRRPPVAPLPAPYESPWLALRRALVAVLSSLRLKLWELWRRNRQGELPRPGPWPPALAPLFWPLLLAVAGLLLVALLGRWPGPAPQAAPAAGSVAAGDGRLAERAIVPEAPPAAAGNATSSGGSGDTAISSEHVLSESPLSAVEPAAVPGQGGLPIERDPPTGAEDAAPPAAGEAMRLLELLGARQPGSPLLAAIPRPEQAQLQLQLAPSFGAAPAAQRQAWADQWLAQAREQGYLELILVDASGRPLGRQARVGSGMILLQPLRETR